MKPILDNSVENRYRDYTLKLHVQRLNHIKTRGSHRIDNSCPRTKEIITPQHLGKEFVKKEKNNDITKDNNKFFEILVEISAGKRETVTQKILHSAKESQNRKSLNVSIRKKKETKIMRENEEFFKRLEKTSTDLSVEKFNKEWALSNKYKNTIRRKTPRYSSSEFVKTFYLPPLGNGAKDETFRNEEGSSELRKKKKKGTTMKSFRTGELNEKNIERVHQEENKQNKEGFFVSAMEFGDEEEKREDVGKAKEGRRTIGKEEGLEDQSEISEEKDGGAKEKNVEACLEKGHLNSEGRSSRENVASEVNKKENESLSQENQENVELQEKLV